MSHEDGDASLSDVVVIGAGLVGAATAHRLVKTGRSVLLIERREPGGGASGRNQGFLGVQTRRSGPELELAKWGRQLNDHLSQELEGYALRASGGLTIFTDEADVAYAREVANARQRSGLAVRFVDATEVGELCGVAGESAVCGLWHPGDAHQDSAALSVALVDDGKRLGMRTVRDDITHLMGAGDVITGAASRTARYRAGMTVIANGVWANALLQSVGMQVPFEPMRLQAALTGPAPFRFDPIVYGPSAAGLYRAYGEVTGHDPRRFTPPPPEGLDIAEKPALLECIAQRPDGRVLLGCPIDFPGLNEEPSVGAIGWMLRNLSALFPAIGGLALERSWAGSVAMTEDFLPIIDVHPGLAGLVLNVGHAFGNLSASASAALIEAQLAGQPVPVDPAAYRLSRPGLGARKERVDVTR